MVPTSQARFAVVAVVGILLAGALVTSRPETSKAGQSRLLVAFSPENMPRGIEGYIDRMAGVEATTVRASTDWMTRSKRQSGAVIQDPPENFGFPMDVAVIQPGEYARLVARGASTEINKLENNKLLLSRPARELRHGGIGMRLLMTGRWSRVVDIVGTGVTQGYEALKSNPVPRAWPNVVRFLIIRANTSVSKREIKTRIRQRLASGAHLVVRSEYDVKYLRYGASPVRPMSAVKKAFGEFPGRPHSDGRIEIRPWWRRKNIRTDSVPILGRVTCHRKLFHQLRGALREVRNKGLSSAIHRDEYAGCFVSRYIATIPKTRVSRHSWGIALDINARSNCLGCTPTMNRRVVRIFQRWGFVWGGRFALPDGMHFEWIRFE